MKCNISSLSRKVSARFIVATLVGLVLTMSGFSGALTSPSPLALPEVSDPFPGDPRLEPIPGFPIHLVNFPVFVNGKQALMRFPPRVNGQTQSDGDKHADMFILFNAATGLPINQPVILEAVPKNAAAGVSDLDARLFSAIWELHVVLVDPSYNPNNLSMRIDSALKVETSPLVKKSFQTNIFLNCPVVPVGSTVDPGSPPVEPAFFNGQIVNIVRYDLEDGGFNPQILFKFEDANGNVLGGPHLVASKEPGQNLYSPIWEVWTVTVPLGQEAAALNAKSAVDVKNLQLINGATISSSGIRLNCPFVAIDRNGDGLFSPGEFVPFEDPIALLTDSTGRFNPLKFPFDVPATSFRQARTHIITEVNPGGAVEPALLPGASATGFPPIDPTVKGNVIPLILTDPLLANCIGLPNICPSGPNTTGDIIRVNQAALDTAFADSSGPRLPADLEANFSLHIATGLLDPSWAPGVRPYQERLGLVGRAFFELVWTAGLGGNQPAQGSSQDIVRKEMDVTSCLACHSTSAEGGAARQLYTLNRTAIPGGGGVVSPLNPGSMFGSGGSELLVRQIKTALGEGTACGGPLVDAGVFHTCAHGSTGGIASIRATVTGAFNTHVGIQSSEFIVGQSNVVQPNGQRGWEKCGCGANPCTLAEAATCDLDGDGVVNEMTVGEVTATTVFLLGLPVPDEALMAGGSTSNALRAMGVTRRSVEAGRRLFRRSIANRGAGCVSCHTPFHPFPDGTTTLMVSNPETGPIPLQVETDAPDPGVAVHAEMSPLIPVSGIPIQVSHHLAQQNDVNDGLASLVGQPGLRNYGDIKKHQVPLAMKGLPGDATLVKTAELWDAGSVFPYLRSGKFGSNLSATILAHEGTPLSNVALTFGRLTNVSGTPGVKKQTLTILNTSLNTIDASPASPLRVVLTGIRPMAAGRSFNHDGITPGGTPQRGAFWLITEPIPAGGSVMKELQFQTSRRTLRYTLAIYDHAGFSDAVAPALTFKQLRPTSQQAIINFLRVQLINGKLGEGSGGDQ